MSNASDCSCIPRQRDAAGHGAVTRNMRGPWSAPYAATPRPSGWLRGMRAGAECSRTAMRVSAVSKVIPVTLIRGCPPTRRTAAGIVWLLGAWVLCHQPTAGSENSRAASRLQTPRVTTRSEPRPCRRQTPRVGGLKRLRSVRRHAHASFSCTRISCGPASAADWQEAEA